MLLANALSYGYAEIDPEFEPLKVNLPYTPISSANMLTQNLDTNILIGLPDTPYQLFIGGGGDESTSRESILTDLRIAWEGYPSRQSISEDEWVTGLTQRLEKIVDLRIARVTEWLNQNLARFQTASGGSYACIDELKRFFDSSIVDMKSSVQLCGLTCAMCHLRCVQSRMHVGPHDCRSDHVCVHECDFCLAFEWKEHQLCRMG